MATVTAYDIEKANNVRILAAVCGFMFFAIILSWIGYAGLSKQDVPDWDGYRALYMNYGGYLDKHGRDPLFVWFIDRAGDLFGGDGYERFRLALLALFVWSGALLVGRSIWDGSMPVTTMLAVMAAFYLKSIAQIREGLAFLLIMWGTLTAFRGAYRGLIWSAVGAVLGVAMHAGMIIFLGAWVAAVGVLVCGRGVVSDRFLPVLLVIAGCLFGVGLAWWVGRHEALATSTLRDIGIETNSDVVVTGWKYTYWAAMGVMVLILQEQLRFAGYIGRWFSYAYATTLGSFVIPMVYVTCLSMVVGQGAASVVSMVIRVLLSTMELGLVIVAASGRARWPTGLVGAFLLADEVRTGLGL